MINRQQHFGTCGATAIANLAQHVGIPMSYKNSLKFFKDAINENPLHGAWLYTVRSALNVLGIKHRCKKNLKMKDIERELDKGNSMIFLYAWCVNGKRGGHYVFINGHTDKYITAYNASKVNTSPRITKKKLSDYIKYSHRHQKGIYTSALIVKGGKHE